MRRAPEQTPQAGTARRRGTGPGPRGTAVALLVFMVACSAESGAPEPSPPGAAAAPTTSATTTSTVPPTTALDRGQVPAQELSFGEYQQVLVQADQQVVASLRKLAETRSYGALRRQTVQSARTVTGAGERLGEIEPPAHLNAHHGIVRRLKAIGAALSDMALMVDDRELCAAPAVVAELRALPVTEELRVSTQALADAGGGRVTFVPDLPTPAAHRPGSGEHLRPKGTSGAGVLLVTMVGERDGVVSLSRGGSAVLEIYLHGGLSDLQLVEGLAVGAYDAFYTRGLDWIPDLRTFARDCVVGRLDAPVDVHATPGRQVAAINLPGRLVTGDTPSTPISPDEFPR